MEHKGESATLFGDLLSEYPERVASLAREYWSQMEAKFGRSKEKRYDCKLLVLALCVNTAGFIRYSAVLEGNAADPQTLPDMIEEFARKNPTTGADSDKALVVIDAGISSEDNLALIKEKGFHYLCVSRKNLTEESMNRQYRQRFEDMLEAIRKGLSTKGGTKRYEKVCERVGRARGKYPSIQRFYDIGYVLDKKGTTVTDINWTIKTPEKMDANVGIYFLCTDKPEMDERTAPATLICIWDCCHTGL